jgi:hypothetical protein
LDPLDRAPRIDRQADPIAVDFRRLIDDDPMIHERRLVPARVIVEHVFIDEKADVAVEAHVAVDRLDFLPAFAKLQVAVVAHLPVTNLAEPIGDLARHASTGYVVVYRRQVHDQADIPRMNPWNGANASILPGSK